MTECFLSLFRYFRSLVIAASQLEEQANNNGRDNRNQELAHGPAIGGLGTHAGYFSIEGC